MSKVICDICGTIYQDTAETCPICGCSRDFSEQDVGASGTEEETAAVKTKGGRFSAANLKKKNREIFDYDAVNTGEEEDEEDEETVYAEDAGQEKPKTNTILVILLVVVIMLLLAASGFLFLRYFLPNMLGIGETVPTVVTTAPTETQVRETTEPTVPCEVLVLTSGVAELNKKGQFWLLHVKVMPEDTTDKLTFVSGDESIATVTEDGKITAVGEGKTNIYITCGKQQIICSVVVDYSLAVPETTAGGTMPVLEAGAEGETEGVEETEGAEETQAPEETTQAATAPPEITLKLGKSDISLVMGYQFQMPLDCDLKPEDIQWSTEHSYIAKVDDKGLVTAIGPGVTAVIAKYGDQEVQCIVRVKGS